MTPVTMRVVERFDALPDGGNSVSLVQSHSYALHDIALRFSSFLNYSGACPFRETARRIERRRNRDRGASLFCSVNSYRTGGA